ncbi:MAG: DUF4423 domain-containing protein, partial [Bdellovibrionaceae bacterium]|nr:DUF4423 domain-containing protein [Bdellovibrio sp.]
MVILFDYSNYKKYLDSSLGPGIKTKFAAHIGCQPSFLSQVLRGEPNLSLEQGYLANEFLKHTALETQYFMLLLQKSRAGSQKLTAYFQKELDTILNSRNKFVARIQDGAELSEQIKGVYYSSWVYPLVHVLVSVPTSNQIGFLVEKTALSRESIIDILQFLEKNGLITKEKTGDKYSVTKKRIHIPAGSQLVLQHHRNLRNRVQRCFDEHQPSNLHYSSFLALSEKDVLKIEKIFLNAIEQSEEIL